MKIVVLIYYHPEFYPPTLNAILNLADLFESVTVITKNTLQSDFKYPPNVSLIKIGAFKTIKETEQLSLISKGFSFLSFCKKAFSIIQNIKPAYIVAYDSIPLLTLTMLRPMLPKTKMWYHNHDISEINQYRKFSIGWFAAKYEKKAFSFLNIFSLPAKERLDYFRSFKEGKTKFFYLPNFPSKKIYHSFHSSEPVSQEVNLIYQGSVGPGHGLEEIIDCLDTLVAGMKLNLFVKGNINNEFKTKLIDRARLKGVEKQLSFFGITPYVEVPKLTQKAHIGLAIHMGTDVMNRTLGTASNKIYEYAAVGLPVLLYDNSHFREHCDKYDWAFFTTCTRESLIKCFNEILFDYTRLSKAAKSDFENQLNYEYHFQEIQDLIAHDFPKAYTTHSAI
ncbi:MAG: glycosyltransferase [Chitinophagaceae bacterium]